MGKKNPEVMAKMRGKFVEGAKKQRHQREEGGAHLRPDGALRRLRLQQVALDGLRASSRTRRRISRRTIPWHFAAALLTIEAQNTDKLALYLGECRDRGIPVLPPDINESQLRFTVEPGKGVRFGLTAIKNVGEGAIESLLEVREEAGPHHVAARAVRGSRPAAGQQARVREPGQGRRVRFARRRTRRVRRRCRRARCGRG